MQNRFLALCFLTMVIFWRATFSWAGYNTLSVALNGYDVVAYHTQNEAVVGQFDHFSYYKGLLYLFSSDENKKLFDKDEQKYLPQYGGYCAMAMAKGKKHPADPLAFKVVNNKLYLNGHKKEVQEEWAQDVSGNIKKADHNWKKIQNINPEKLL